jgi:hypothetical protein
MYRVSERRASRPFLSMLFYSYRCRSCDTNFWCLSSNLIGWRLRRLTAVLATIAFLLFVAGSAWLVVVVLAP